MNFKIIFNMDGAGVIYDPFEPIHFDDVLTWALAPRQGVKVGDLRRDDVPAPVALPLLQKSVNGHRVWCASAIVPVGETGEDLQYWRKRMRSGQLDMTSGSPNTQNGTYRDWNTPMPIVLCTQMVAYASGSRKRVKKALKDELRYLGKKRAYGLGGIVSIEYEDMGEEDYSLLRDGKAMRWLPSLSGARMVRAKPPYWNRVDRVRCCEVGEELTDAEIV